MPAAQPLAYSYVRFSTPQQAAGDSLRRQTAATAEWCAKNGVALDSRTTLHDLGKSAFRGAHRENPDRNALAGFLRLVEKGSVPRGSYLIIENLDRLTREDIQPALLLVLNLLQAGVRVVQLRPEMVFDDKSDTLPVMMMMVELSRGHSESARKSERNGGAWEEKRQAARAGRQQPPRKKDGRLTSSMTGQLPAWVEDSGGVLRLQPKRAAAVRRIYALAADGLGAGLIVKELARERFEPMGPSGKWSRAYVSLVLNDRRALGEFQPRHRDGRKAGDAIAGYYPPAVSEAEWHAARAGAGGRRQPRGRVGEHVNVFAGLLWNARGEDDRYYVCTRTNNRKRRRVLIAESACEHGGEARGLDLDVFERKVLACLQEVDPKEVLGDAPGQDEVRVIAGELAHIEAQQEALAAELLKGDVAALAKAARTLDARQKELTEQLAEARAKAAHPAGECWGEAMSLIDVLDGAPDPKAARLKLRSLLRRLVSGIWVLVVPLSATRRVAAVQVFFEGDGHREYAILSQSAGHRRKAIAEVMSLADVIGANDLDLRKRDHARRLEKALAAAPLERGGRPEQ
jgi:DNA invertase Pin-like site-specific DNA recombinase